MTETSIVRWQDWSGSGLEHLVLREDEHGYLADSTILGPKVENSDAFSARYHMRCDRDWKVRGVKIQTADGRRLILTANGAGTWCDAASNVMPQLNGAIDIDLSASPFTNTLPIRRLALVEGESRDVDVVYVRFPELDLSRTPQRYTRLDHGRRYRFEALDGGFTREIEVDERGLVTLYPDLFRRTL